MRRWISKLSLRAKSSIRYPRSSIYPIRADRVLLSLILNPVSSSSHTIQQRRRFVLADFTPIANARHRQPWPLSLTHIGLPPCLSFRVQSIPRDKSPREDLRNLEHRHRTFSPVSPIPRITLRPLPRKPLPLRHPQHLTHLQKHFSRRPTGLRLPQRHPPRPTRPRHHDLPVLAIVFPVKEIERQQIATPQRPPKRRRGGEVDVHGVEGRGFCDGAPVFQRQGGCEVKGVGFVEDGWDFGVELAGDEGEGGKDPEKVISIFCFVAGEERGGVGDLTGNRSSWGGGRSRRRRFCCGFRRGG